MTPTESTASCNAMKILTHEEFAEKHPHPPSPVNVRIDRHANNNIDRHSEAAIDQQPPALIDRRAPITYRVQMPKIDVARLNGLRPKPKPSEYPPETPSTRRNTQRRLRLTQQHRSTVAISNRPTYHMTNRSIVVQMIGRTTTTIPLLPHTPDNTCIQKIMMKTMRRNELLTSSDTAYYKSIDTEVNRAQEGDYSIGSWADEHHHESFAVETATYAPGADKLQDSFNDEELLNMQIRDGIDHIRSEAACE
ncbi:hypothetical protein F2Q69_00005933 [Brassica cretica]|uniref:Uncharacterized protein n=1 Tax=Brassica cretica TaxID=69181 RepID=A0A8S9P4T8_BRACR|nr:hypothetical protein F2Q69_00005933 [Brassica cretica]